MLENGRLWLSAKKKYIVRIVQAHNRAGDKGD